MGLLDFIFGESKDDLRAKIEDVQEKNKAQLAEINSLKVSFGLKCVKFALLNLYGIAIKY